MSSPKKPPAAKAAGEKRKATLRDIARLCGVSPMAVSMAINNKDGISRETSERIRKAIRKLNYTPNMVAKSLRVSATKTIGVVMSDSSQLLFTKLLRGIADAADDAGYSIVMGNTDQNPDRERRAIDVLVDKRIDGLFLAAPLLADDDKIRQLTRHGIPIVMAMRSSDYPIDSVCTDNYHGAYAVTEYLAKSGSRDLHMINLPRRSQSGAERLRGFKRALADNGLTCDLRSVPHVNPQIADGRDAMRKLLERGWRGDAVFCACDLLAIGAMEALRESGFKIPRDVRICGFDDIEMLDHLAVPLTTFRQPIDQMAKTGFELLLERIASPSLPPRRLALPGELVLRKST